MNIMIVRLITGEEILGEVESFSDKNECLIKNPTQISVGRNPKTEKIDIHMGPWLPLSADKQIKINSNVIACCYIPVIEIVNKYNSLFGSGIVIPDNSSISLV